MRKITAFIAAAVATIFLQPITANADTVYTFTGTCDTDCTGTATATLTIGTTTTFTYQSSFISNPAITSSPGVTVTSLSGPTGTLPGFAETLIRFAAIAANPTVTGSQSMDTFISISTTGDWCLGFSGGGNSVKCDLNADGGHNGIWSVAPVPLPAALPLFATGLGALGLLGWCRKRKTLAA